VVPAEAEALKSTDTDQTTVIVTTLAANTTTLVMPTSTHTVETHSRHTMTMQPHRAVAHNSRDLITNLLLTTTLLPVTLTLIINTVVVAIEILVLLLIITDLLFRHHHHHLEGIKAMGTITIVVNMIVMAVAMAIVTVTIMMAHIQDIQLPHLPRRMASLLIATCPPFQCLQTLTEPHRLQQRGEREKMQPEVK